MSAVLASFLGFPYETALFLTTVAAALATFLAMVGVVFLAWAPYLSGSWATQFGVGRVESDDETTSTGAD